MAITGAADRVPIRFRMLVYLDALIPEDGQSAVDLLPGGFAEMVRAAADESGHGWVANPEALLPPAGLIPEEDRARYIARLRDQPAATFTEPMRLTGATARLPRAFIRCTGGQLDVGGDPIEPMAARARAAGWLYRCELNAPDDPHLFDPPVRLRSCMSWRRPDRQTTGTRRAAARRRKLHRAPCPRPRVVGPADMPDLCARDRACRRRSGATFGVGSSLMGGGSWAHRSASWRGRSELGRARDREHQGRQRPSRSPGYPAFADIR